ncbi:DUF3084 domain-containing protein [Limnochorda pilosa]|uniref:DUF3084 domain-containing protein n=1 Tax=Limnochorda pilosa TaxID=1555112 RepID=A0A0K2SPF4_LIMPI|nr:DUF3084 domain-containing protein [Limnochorda pilosa]BAS28882.1 hypothetical protein LIP_3053 [Limnochorda pilosa]
MHGWRLIVTLVIMGGAIAYLGDRIGLRVGKRRLTLFGLRPRHTSIIITILTGVVITAASVGLLSLASADVRTALFRMSEIQQALTTTRDRLQMVEGELSAQQERLAATLSERNQAVKEMDAAKAELQSAVDQLANARTQLDEAQRSLAFQEERVKNLTRIGKDLQGHVDELQATRDRLQEQVATLTQEYLQLAYAMRSGKLAYRADELVGATVLDASVPVEQVQKRLLAFLDEEEKRVRSRLDLPDEKPALVFESQDVFYYTAQEMASKGGRWVARIRAVNNTFAGEPLLVGFELIPEARVYTRNQVIARRTVDGSDPEAVESELLQLLWDVNEQAIQDGMMTDEQGLVGQVAKADEFLDVIIAVKQAGKPVEVIARAREDTWNTRPPLTVTLEVVSS